MTKICLYCKKQTDKIYCVVPYKNGKILKRYISFVGDCCLNAVRRFSNTTYQTVDKYKTISNMNEKGWEAYNKKLSIILKMV